MSEIGRISSRERRGPNVALSVGAALCSAVSVLVYCPLFVRCILFDEKMLFLDSLVILQRASNFWISQKAPKLTVDLKQSERIKSISFGHSTTSKSIYTPNAQFSASKVLSPLIQTLITVQRLHLGILGLFDILKM